ncbi:MAG: IS110 family transposase [Thermoanaerobaculia bacterium]
MDQTTRQKEFKGIPEVLYLAFELGRKEWKLAFSVGRGEKPRLRNLAAGDLRGLEQEIERAGQRWGVAEGARVVSCYEAGRDGFWLHRFLLSRGISNTVVDSSSIEVNRRSRRAKTDRLDAQKLLKLLIRHDLGEEKVWSVVRVPSVEQEADRQLHRDWEELKQERTLHRNRIQALLACQGITVKLGADFGERLESLVLWDGSALPVPLQERLQREWERLELVEEQIRELKRQREEAVVAASDESLKQIQKLATLKGIGLTSAWLFVREFFGWRQFRNRREVAALAGLVPMPFQSGSTAHEQGISKAGNVRLRTMAIEIAWSWLRYQPTSQLSLWFRERYGPGSSRSRRVGIVALARKLLVSLWRFLETGVVPEGAILK